MSKPVNVATAIYSGANAVLWAGVGIEALLKDGHRQVAIFVQANGDIEVSSPIPTINAAEPPKDHA